MTSRNQGLSPNDKGRQRRESLGTRLRLTSPGKGELMRRAYPEGFISGGTYKRD